MNLINNGTRYLIVNADDFGQSPGVTSGIITAYEAGIVTSTSLMVRGSAAATAAAYARHNPQLSVGLHVDLGEWAYTVAQGWIPVYEVVPADDALLVEEEIARQLASFHTLVGRSPSHLDSHQHVHRHEPAHHILLSMARELNVPLRGHSPDIHYRGDFYGQTEKGEPFPQAITLDAFAELLHTLPAGVTELGCHPGDGKDFVSMYSAERAIELAVLCDPRVRTILLSEEIHLRSFQP